MLLACQLIDIYVARTPSFLVKLQREQLVEEQLKAQQAASAAAGGSAASAT